MNNDGEIDHQLHEVMEDVRAILNSQYDPILAVASRQLRDLRDMAARGCDVDAALYLTILCRRLDVLIWKQRRTTVDGIGLENRVHRPTPSLEYPKEGAAKAEFDEMTWNDIDTLRRIVCARDDEDICTAAMRPILEQT